MASIEFTPNVIEVAARGLDEKTKDESFYSVVSDLMGVGVMMDLEPEVFIALLEKIIENRNQRYLQSKA